MIALLAVSVWCGVGYFAWTISAAAEAHHSEIAGMEQQTADRAFALRLHALARETKDERSRLDTLSHTSLNKILDAVEAITRDAGVRVEMVQAPSISRGDPSSMVVVSLSAEATGTFAQVTRVVALLETMSIPSTVDEVRFELAPVSGASARAPWRVIASVRVLTKADIPTL